MGGSCTKVRCRTPWCDRGLEEKYYLESNGKHPRHESLQYWHFTVSDNIYTTPHVISAFSNARALTNSQKFDFSKFSLRFICNCSFKMEMNLYNE